MIPEALLAELQNLSHAEKLRVVQILVNELALVENETTERVYEVWSPLDSAEAASVLKQMLAEEQSQHG